MEQNSSTSDTISQLIEALSDLPGIGPKSAQRLAYYLLRAPEEQTGKLGQAILSLKKNTCLCSKCFNVTDSKTCPICRNTNRNREKHSSFCYFCINHTPSQALALHAIL